MKKNKMIRIFILTSLLLPISLVTFGTPIGANLNSPIIVGTLNVGNTFTDTKSNAPANGYGNNIGQASDDIYYKFVLNTAAKVNLSHCASGFDTYMYLLDANGNTISSNDDNGPLCSGLKSSISTSLAPGTYFVVSEGYGANSGNITTTINVLLAGTDINNPITVGVLSASNSTFNDSKNNGAYGNNYGQASDDIFYKFSINATTQISISLCSSGFDTYMHLLDI